LDVDHNPSDRDFSISAPRGTSISNGDPKSAIMVKATTAFGVADLPTLVEATARQANRPVDRSPTRRRVTIRRRPVWLVLRSSALGGIMRQRWPLALQTSREVFSLSDTLAAGKPLAGLVILGIR